MKAISNNCIPKIIHYCWFGGQPLPELAQRCIASWRKYLPDYAIVEWNESNFNLNCCAYVREAYEAKKWAFVSDYARFDILYQYGGLYFDTDVELIRSIDDIAARGSFMGCERQNDDKSGDVHKRQFAVAPGLGLGAVPGLALYKEILEHYRQSHFLRPNGEQDHTTVVERTTDILEKHGFRQTDDVQQFAGITVYPPRYFCPVNYATGELTLTEDTYSIHHYAASWHSRGEELLGRVQQYFNRRGSAGKRIGVIVQMPLRMYCKIEKSGLKGTAIFIWRKLKRGGKAG